MQEELALKLSNVSGYKDYALFLCNSGAEANENALKIASFSNGRKKVIAFTNAFHGRTSGTVAITDNNTIVAPYNSNHEVVWVSFNDKAAFENAIGNDISAVIIEGIQGVGGIRVPDIDFLKIVSEKCQQYGVYLILDEIQSGYGRTGKFFAHQYASINADMITMAKGMGNGFPMGAVLINPNIKSWKGMLGTTFGGNHLACAAGLAVLEVMQDENLILNAALMGEYLITQLQKIPHLKEIRGKGLMVGIELPEHKKQIRNKLLEQFKIFTGTAEPNTIRLLPPLNITKHELDIFLQALSALMN
jgi:acetylornithine/N-succinyldiaminopimelate aminotransferase